VVITAGYQGTPAPNQWFGGPALFSISASSFTNRPPVLNAGNIVLRDAAGLVVDSLNYGGLVDPWASEGYQAASGTGEIGCQVSSPGPAGGFGPAAAAIMTNRSAGRFPDGADTDSNCADFHLQPATTLSADSSANATNIKVASVADFAAGQSIAIDTGAGSETAVIQTVGTAGATTVGTATSPGATTILVANPAGFHSGQTITIDSGANQETVAIASTTFNRNGASITVSEPLKFAHAVGAQVSGSGITLTHALSQAHANGAQVVSKHPTPGAPNQYYAGSH
jgi:non-reducing end alpha-L-arabinofuranosidase